MSLAAVCANCRASSGRADNSSSPLPTPGWRNLPLEPTGWAASSAMAAPSEPGTPSKKLSPLTLSSSTAKTSPSSFASTPANSNGASRKRVLGSELLFPVHKDLETLSRTNGEINIVRLRIQRHGPGALLGLEVLHHG